MYYFCKYSIIYAIKMHLKELMCVSLQDVYWNFKINFGQISKPILGKALLPCTLYSQSPHKTCAPVHVSRLVSYPSFWCSLTKGCWRGAVARLMFEINIGASHFQGRVFDSRSDHIRKTPPAVHVILDYPLWATLPTICFGCDMVKTTTAAMSQITLCGRVTAHNLL
jgi:hypothetical protein